MLKNIRSDNGEFKPKQTDSYCRVHGILQSFTASYLSAQNGVVERAHYTTLNAVIAMLRFSGLPKHFWPEAASNAIYTKNRSPYSSLNQKPYEI